ncbi:hypothetical protein H0H92_007636 [Tricholoma furcatifolium]|nr:hypothetical protein H0H92_007636 [Tricholoma furcatifolium]
MRPSLFLLGLGLTATAQASSWFGSSEPHAPYSSWSVADLTTWLDAYNIHIPFKTPTQADLKRLVQENWDRVATWSYDQYTSAQEYFADLHHSSFDTWDESQLRQFLLEQGIVAPKGNKEQLLHLCKSQYRAYSNAASSFAEYASTAAHGDSKHQATQSLSSFAAHATDAAGKVLDNTKDYVYSSWDDNKLRRYLESHGIALEDEKHSRNQLLDLMRDTYAKVADPVYEAFSDSYLHNWLVSHNVIHPTPPAPHTREYLLSKMQKYYYDVNDSVYSTWSDSQLKAWLVEHDIIKSNAQLKREKLVKLVHDNYLSAKSTMAGAWSDSQLREYLVENGFIDTRSAAKIKRDELVKMFADKYNAVVTPSYLTWPDARLRAYLRQHNLPEEKLPGSRPGLLQETRIRWVETKTTADVIWARVRDIVGGVEGGIEGRLGNIWNILKNYGTTGECTGQECDCVGKDCKCSTGECSCAGKECDCFGAKCSHAKRAAKENVERGKRYAGETFESAQEEGGRKYSEAEKEYEGTKERAYAKGQGAKENVGEKIKVAAEKLMGKTEL